MANYTKRDKSNAQMFEMIETWRTKEWKPPLCYCGAPAVIEVNTFTGVSFYCTAHLPMDPLGEHKR